MRTSTAADGGRQAANYTHTQPVEPAPLPPGDVTPPDGEVPLSAPEPAFAARVPEPEPERPLPSARRAIFFDVENTSRAEHIAHVIEHLAVDRTGRRTDFVAVGNWRVIGTDTARLLAHHGAQLVHSAPSTGVRDWSDLRIAVAAGVWLAAARPGDAVEIVSDDRAFDAVGDVAASLGIVFRRLSYRGLAGMPEEAEPAREVQPEPEPRRRRRGWRRAGRPVAVAPRPGPVVAVTLPSAEGGPAGEPAAEPHTAPHDEIVAVVRDLAATGRVTTLDSLANALKARGFSRPPGSPRLITRLRRIREISVNRSGVISLVEEGRRDGDAGSAAGHPEPAGAVGNGAADVATEAAPGVEIETGEAPGPMPDEQPPAPAAPRRRRSRRGGRRRRQRSRGAAASVAV